jgi:DTW domain-containing protein YfiP
VRSFTSADLPGRCKRCWVKDPHCVCAEVPLVRPRTEVVVVRHQREGWKSTGTTRIAALALPSLRCLEYGDDALPARDELTPALLEGAAVLFPAEPAAPWDAAATRRLVVLDGTWRQARRMFKRLPALHALPRLSLPPAAAPVRRLRSTTFEDGRSTLEAIADALALLEGPGVAAPLHALHALFVARTLQARGVAPVRAG